MQEWVIEASGVALALLYLLLAMYQLRSCWIVGLVSSILYVAVYFRAALYTESALQIFYALAAVYGYFAWGKPQGSEPFYPRYWNAKRHLVAGAYCCIPALIVAEILARHSDASFPHLDAILTSFSILATLMTAWKLIENWIYWIVIDLLSAALYLVKGLDLTAALFGVYVILAFFGWREWRKILVQGSASF